MIMPLKVLKFQKIVIVIVKVKNMICVCVCVCVWRMWKNGKGKYNMWIPMVMAFAI